MPARRRIRWDRVGILAVLMIALIFMLGFCCQRCSDERTPPISTADSSSAVTPTPGTQTGTSSEPAVSGSSTANLPIIITDVPEPSGSTPILPETTTTVSTLENTPPPVTLPAGYQEVGITAEQMYRGSLILVDQNHPCQLTKDELQLDQVYYASDKPDTYDISYPGHTALNRTALTQFNRLMKSYFGATNNKEIMFNYGWLEEGKEKSNPESATALDIQLHLKLSSGGYAYPVYRKPYAWLYDNMANYGFVLRYPSDKFDVTGVNGGYTAIRYVGVPHAAFMAEHNYCLEEYLQLLREQYSFGKAMLEYSTTELSYNIYYVPAAATGTTSVPVPRTGSYEISGNNTDGFIVTVIVG